MIIELAVERTIPWPNEEPSDQLEQIDEQTAQTKTDGEEDLNGKQRLKVHQLENKFIQNQILSKGTEKKTNSKSIYS